MRTNLMKAIPGISSINLAWPRDDNPGTTWVATVTKTEKRPCGGDGCRGSKPELTLHLNFGSHVWPLREISHEKLEKTILAGFNRPMPDLQAAAIKSLAALAKSEGITMPGICEPEKAKTGS